MRGLTNDCLRRLIAYSIALAGLGFTCVQRIRMMTFARRQERLRHRYKIACHTPVLSYGPELEELIQKAVIKAGKNARFAVTSGSTGRPKRFLYTKARLHSLKLTFTDVFVRYCWTFSIKRTSLYVFSSFSKDYSLTSMLLEEDKLPGYLSTLQAPYRVQQDPAIQALAAHYGTTAVRLWILTIANPGVLYSTNPSTISTFLDELANSWHRSAALIRDWGENLETFDPAIQRIARRIEARGSAQRLARIAKSDAPLSLEICAPAVGAYFCWTGGYVKPFLDRIAKYLPAPRYRLIPMYSMSTETVETVSHFDDEGVSFLPLAEGVLYEFIPDGKTDKPNSLLLPGNLQVGQTYAMVVSDSYGLRRYQTGDLFLCTQTRGGLPDLHFVRRRNLEYSFTGEKVTAEHVSAVFEQLRGRYPQLPTEQFLTCVPSHPMDEETPHYKVLLVGDATSGLDGYFAEMARSCDQLLSELNCEYRSKRTSGRLAAVRFMEVTAAEFVERVSGAQHKSWETQFKFLPLYRSTWEYHRTAY